MRRSLVMGNWKMNGSSAQNAELIQGLASIASSGAEAAVCVPYVYISQVKGLLGDSGVLLGAQDISEHEKGAYTGEISGAMLADMACQFALVGHSERRQYHNETNELTARKVLAALKAGITPVLCVGETLQERESEQTLKVIESQLTAVFDALDAEGMKKLVIAYEPVWAIGTGLTASPEQAQEVHAFIRSKLGAVADSTRILYGGSVKAKNAAELFEQQDIDGALVGGASLIAEEFVNIVAAA